jgi:WD40 repeat protein
MIAQAQVLDTMSNRQYAVEAFTSPVVNGGSYQPLRVDNLKAGTYFCHFVPAKQGSFNRNFQLVYISNSALLSLAALDRFLGLSPSWGDGERPNPAAIKIAKGLVNQLDFFQLSPSRISASAEGGIALGFYRNSRYAGIEVLNDSSVTALTSDLAGTIKVWDVDLMNLNGTVDQIREHLEA